MKYDMLTHLTTLLESKKGFCKGGSRLNWLRSLGWGSHCTAVPRPAVSADGRSALVLSSDGISHEAVRRRYHRAKKPLCEPSKRCRKTIAIDETKIKVEKRWYYLWTAIDMESRELLGVQLTLIALSSTDVTRT